MENEKLNILFTGATGMVGEGVLNECLNHDAVGKVMIITRKPSGLSHPKVSEVITNDFGDLKNIADNLQEFNTCVYCIGTTSMGKTKEQYEEINYRLTIDFAQALVEINRGITFCYIAAAGTDSSEKGKSFWANIKGKTENVLMQLPFRGIYSFRPLMLTPTAGMNHTHGFYKFISWLFPLGWLIKPDWFCTLKELGTAMIKVARAGYSKPTIEVRDMVAIAGEH